MKFDLESRIKIQKKSVNYVLNQFIKIIEIYKFD